MVAASHICGTGGGRGHNGRWSVVQPVLDPQPAPDSTRAPRLLLKGAMRMCRHTSICPGGGWPLSGAVRPNHMAPRAWHMAVPGAAATVLVPFLYSVLFTIQASFFSAGRLLICKVYRYGLQCTYN